MGQTSSEEEVWAPVHTTSAVEFPKVSIHYSPIHWFPPASLTAPVCTDASVNPDASDETRSSRRICHRLYTGSLVASVLQRYDDESNQ